MSNHKPVTVFTSSGERIETILIPKHNAQPIIMWEGRTFQHYRKTEYREVILGQGLSIPLPAVESHPPHIETGDFNDLVVDNIEVHVNEEPVADKFDNEEE